MSSATDPDVLPPPTSPRAKWDIAVLLVALIFPTVATWLYFVALANDGGGANVAVQWAMVLGKVVQFTFPIAYVFIVDRGRLGSPRFHQRGFWPAVAFGVVTAAATFALYYGVLRRPILRSPAPQAAWAKLVELGCDTPLRYLLLATFISMAHSLLEEYYWRWFVFGRLRLYLRRWPAIIISSLGFMAHHVIVLGVYFPNHFWTLAVPFSLGVAIGGGIWARLYDESRSLYGVWISHLLVDAAILAVGYDMVAQYFLQPG